MQYHNFLMKRSLLLINLAFAPILGLFNIQTMAIAASKISHPTTEPQFQPVVSAIEAQMKAQNVPGLAVAIVQNGKVTFQRGFGVRNTETKDPVTPATLFRIGSTTKPLTVIGVMQLVEAGKVKLDDPVVKYIPEFKVNPQITVRQIISHSSGLADGGDPYGRTDADALKNYVASLKPQGAFAPPATVLSYSNPAFSVAGYLIERVSGMNYADYMAKNVFPVLGMTRTTLLPNVALTYPLAVGYQPSTTGIEVVRPNPDNAVEYAAGFAFSSVEDLSRLMLFLLQDGKLNDKTVLSTSSMQAMKTPVLRLEAVNLGYGLGLFVEPKDGITTIGHGGTINGYTASLRTIPAQNFGIVILANQQGFNSTPIVEAATKSLLKLPQSNVTPPIKLDDTTLKAYTGNYLIPNISGQPLGTLSIVLEQGKLKGKFTGQPDLEFRPLSSDAFTVVIENTLVGNAAFIRDKSGKIVFLNYGVRAYPRLES